MRIFKAILADDVAYNRAYAYDYRVYGHNGHEGHYAPEAAPLAEPQYFGQSEHRSDDRVMGQVNAHDVEFFIAQAELSTKYVSLGSRVKIGHMQ